MNSELKVIYDDLWARARAAMLSGGVEVDPLLHARTPDRRRGLTIIFHPSDGTAASVLSWLAQLTGGEPEQYSYTAEQLHVTVLSLFTATPAYALYFARLPRYLDVLDALLPLCARFDVAFRGVTASPSAVMVQGFPVGGVLEQVRAALRAALADAGFGAALDRRYRLQTAHITALRLAAPLRSPSRFVARLDQARTRDFGVTGVGELLLVENDWYMTPGIVRVLRRYPLVSTQPT